MVKSTEVAVKQESGLTIMPEWMQNQAGLGTENVGVGDVEVPRLKLVQALSPELQEHNGIKIGDFFHTLAEANLGHAVRITPIFVDVKFILWKPRKSGGGILARADDGIHWNPPNGEWSVKLDDGAEVRWRTASTVEKSGLANWGSSNPNDPNSPPAATRMYSIVVGFPDDPEMPPAVVTLQRSGIKVARRFIGKLKITRAPAFGLVFEMRSLKERNNSGQDFQSYQFRGAGMVEDKDTYDRFHDLYKYFKSQGVSIKDLESAQGDDVMEDPTDHTPEGAPAI